MSEHERTQQSEAAVPHVGTADPGYAVPVDERNATDADAERLKQVLLTQRPAFFKKHGVSPRVFQRLTDPGRAEPLASAEQAPALFANHFVKSLYGVLKLVWGDPGSPSFEAAYLRILRHSLYEAYSRDITNVKAGKEAHRAKKWPGWDKIKVAAVQFSAADRSGSISDWWLRALFLALETRNGPAVEVHVMDWFPQNEKRHTDRPASEKFLPLGPNLARSLLRAAVPELPDDMIEIRKHNRAAQITNVLTTSPTKASIGIGLYVTSSRMSRGLDFITIPGLRGHLAAAYVTRQHPERKVTWRQIIRGEDVDGTTLQALVMPRELGEEFVSGVCGYAPAAIGLRTPMYERFGNESDEMQQDAKAIVERMRANPNLVLVAGWPLVHDVVKAANADADADAPFAVVAHEHRQTPSFPLGFALPPGAGQIKEILRTALHEDLLGAGLLKQIGWYVDYLVAYYRLEHNSDADAVVDRILSRWYLLSLQAYRRPAQSPFANQLSSAHPLQHLLDRDVSDELNWTPDVRKEFRRRWAEGTDVMRADRADPTGIWSRVEDALLNEMRPYPRRIDLEGITDTSLRNRMKAIVGTLIRDSEDPLMLFRETVVVGTEAEQDAQKLNMANWLKLRLLRDFTYRG